MDNDAGLLHPDEQEDELDPSDLPLVPRELDPGKEAERDRYKFSDQPVPPEKAGKV